MALSGAMEIWLLWSVWSEITVFDLFFQNLINKIEAGINSGIHTISHKSTI